MGLDSYPGKNWKSYIADFNKIYPNIKVEAQTDTNYADNALTRLQGGDWGDIMMIPSVDKSELENYFISYAPSIPCRSRSSSPPRRPTTASPTASPPTARPPASSTTRPSSRRPASPSCDHSGRVHRRPQAHQGKDRRHPAVHQLRGRLHHGRLGCLHRHHRNR